MTDYVFDAEPLVAFRYGEEGAERIEEILEEVYDGDSTAAMSVVRLRNCGTSSDALKETSVPASGRSATMSTAVSDSCRLEVTD